MAIAYGMKGHIGISLQSSFGTANIASFDYFPLISETLALNVPSLPDESMKGGHIDEVPAHEGFHELAGDVVVPVHPILIGKFLKAWTGVASYDATLTASHYTHTFWPDPGDFDELVAVPPMTLEVYRAAGSAHQYHDMLLNTLTLEIAHGAMIKATAGFIGGNYAKVAKTGPTYLIGSEWSWDQSCIQIGGNAIDELSTITIMMNNNLAVRGMLDGNKTASRILREGKRRIEVSGTMLFINDTEFDICTSKTAQAFIVNVEGQACSSGYNTSLRIDLPQVVYDAFPVNLGGPGIVEAAFTGHAEYKTTSLGASLFTLVNTQAAY